MASSLGLEVGAYEVKDLPVNEYTQFRYKYLTSDPSVIPPVVAEKRTVEVVAPEELIAEPPAKKSLGVSLLQPANSTPTTVTAAASSLLTSFATHSGLRDRDGLLHAAGAQPATPRKFPVVVGGVGSGLASVLVPHSAAPRQTSVFTVRQPRPAAVSLLNNNVATRMVSHMAPLTMVNPVAVERPVQPKRGVGRPSKKQALVTPASLPTPHLVLNASPSIQTVVSLAGFPQAAGTHMVSLLPNAVTSVAVTVPQTTTTLDLGSIPLSIPIDDFNLVPGINSDASVSDLATTSTALLPNGDGGDVGAVSLTKVNGEVDSRQTSVLTSVQSSEPSSFIVKSENEEGYSMVDASESLPLSSVGETSSALNVDSVVASSVAVPEPAPLDLPGQDSEAGTKAELNSSVEDHARDGLEASMMGDMVTEGEEQPMEVEESQEGQSFTLHQNATLYQTEDGTVILQNPDGTTFQLQGVGDQGLTLQSVQELLGQMLSSDGSVQINMQQ